MSDLFGIISQILQQGSFDTDWCCAALTVVVVALDAKVVTFHPLGANHQVELPIYMYLRLKGTIFVDALDFGDKQGRYKYFEQREKKKRREYQTPTEIIVTSSTAQKFILLIIRGSTVHCTPFDHSIIVVHVLRSTCIALTVDGFM